MENIVIAWLHFLLLINKFIRAKNYLLFSHFQEIKPPRVFCLGRKSWRQIGKVVNKFYCRLVIWITYVILIYLLSEWFEHLTFCFILGGFDIFLHQSTGTEAHYNLKNRSFSEEVYEDTIHIRLYHMWNSCNAANGMSLSNTVNFLTVMPS